MRTLLLDNAYLPVKVLCWQKAMILLISQRAEVVDVYQEITIRSATLSFQLPKILRLFGRHKGKNIIQFNRLNVYKRDNWTCQYCLTSLAQQELTFDHIIPRSKGGATSWENVVTSCRRCNFSKGSRTPSEANMVLAKKPVRPRWSTHLSLVFGTDDPPEWKLWVASNAQLGPAA